MKKKINKILLCVFLLLIGFSAYSQSKPPVPESPPPSPVGLPIDGGLSFLIIAGAAYGISELRRKK